MVLQLFVGFCKKKFGFEFLKSGTRILPVSYPYPTRINPVFTRIFSSKPWVWNENPGFSLPVSYPYPTRINPVFSRIENMGPYTLSQNGERLAESGIYWYFTQTIKSLNFMNFENLGFCFQTSGLELHPTFFQGSEAQGIYV